MPKLVPLSDTILCEPVIEEIKIDGVKSSDTEKDDKKLRPEKGRVLAVGKDYNGELKEGDIVFYNKFGVEWIEIEAVEYVVGTKDQFYVTIQD